MLLKFIFDNYFLVFFSIVFFILFFLIPPLCYLSLISFMKVFEKFKIENANDYAKVFYIVCALSTWLLTVEINDRTKPFSINSEYSLSINKTKEFILWKTQSIDNVTYEHTKIADGSISIKKPLSSKKEVLKEFLKIQCNELSFDICVNKIKENLPEIVANISDSSKEMQVVKF